LDGAGVGNAHEGGEVGAELLVLLLQLAQGLLVLLDLQLRVLEQVFALALEDLKALLQLLVLVIGARRTRHPARLCARSCPHALTRALELREMERFGRCCPT
jgi:hypothetical protein